MAPTSMIGNATWRQTLLENLLLLVKFILFFVDPMRPKKSQSHLINLQFKISIIDRQQNLRSIESDLDFAKSQKDHGTFFSRMATSTIANPTAGRLLHLSPVIPFASYLTD